MADIIATIESDAKAIGAEVGTFLQAAGTTLAGGVAVVADAQTIASLVAKVSSQDAPTQDDWDALRAVQTANDSIINAPYKARPRRANDGASFSCRCDSTDGPWRRNAG